MSNQNQSVSGGGKSLPIVLSGMVGGAAGGAIALLSRNWIDLGFWFGLVAFLVLLLGGMFIGRFVGSRLFRGST